MMAAATIDDGFMRQALALAACAREAGEVPVGAVVVLNDEVIGRGYNRPIGLCDPSAHAEVLAIRDAAAATGNYRLPGASLYVTLEPCIMCAGAILHARIERVVFAARDERFGAAGSAVNLLESEFLNHRCAVLAGVLSDESAAMLKGFFAGRRELDSCRSP